MTIHIEFITLVVRIDAIEAKVEGGWDGWLQRYEGLMGSVCQQDEDLFSISTMNPIDMRQIANDYEAAGLILGEDMNVVEMFSSLDDCAWLEHVETEDLTMPAVRFYSSRD